MEQANPELPIQPSERYRQTVLETIRRMFELPPPNLGQQIAIGENRHYRTWTKGPDYLLAVRTVEEDERGAFRTVALDLSRMRINIAPGNDYEGLYSVRMYHYVPETAALQVLDNTFTSDEAVRSAQNVGVDDAMRRRVEEKIDARSSAATAKEYDDFLRDVDGFESTGQA